MTRALVAIIFTTFVQGLWAQETPSTIGIIDTGSSVRSATAPTEEVPAADLSSGRYKVKPRSPKKEKTLTEEYEKSQTLPKKTSPEGKAESLAPRMTDPVSEAPSTLNNQPLAVQPNTPVVNHENRDDEPGLIQRARDMVVGGSPKDLDEYRSFLPPDDPRRNIIDLYAAPIFIYNDSSSPYWFRSYSNFSPGFTTTADIWFTPLFGFEASYRKSITGAVRNSATQDSFVSASHEWVTAGLRFRRFFGYGENVPMLAVGLDYREYNFKVPSDDPNRVRLKTTSPRISIETTIPSTTRYSWRYNLEVTPFSRHQEIGTGYELKSGSENETFGFGVGIGGEYKLARTSRMFFKLSYFLERTAFSGAANRADPNTNTTPSNVPVNNSFTIFEFGYIWGQ